MTLERQVYALKLSLIAEGDYAPGWVLAYGRPHESARSRSVPKYTYTGVELNERVRFAADCPRPVKGRCECPPDGSWRPVRGTLRADAYANRAVYVGTWPDGTWTDALYDKGEDGLWRCIRPHRRAMERLRAESPRRFLVLSRLLDGASVLDAWLGLGEPTNLLQSAFGIVAQVERMAREEALAEYERRPREWRSDDPSWIDKSESQKTAEGGLSGVA